MIIIKTFFLKSRLFFSILKKKVGETSPYSKEVQALQSGPIIIKKVIARSWQWDE